MRVGVDIRSLLSSTGRGVSHYAAALLGELIRQFPGDEWRLLQTGSRAYELPSAWDAPSVGLRHLRVPNKLLNLSLATLGRPAADRLLGGVDVFFAPNLGFVRISRGTPLVLTVHDLSYAIHPAYYRWRERCWHAAVRPRALVNRAARLITVSKQTAREVQETYGFDQARLQVVPSGIDQRYRRPVTAADRRRIREAYGLPERYFLYVGALEPRKNPAGMLEGFRLARAAGLAAQLVLAGTGTAAAAGQQGVSRLGYIPEADKPALYAGATACLLVSWHEGFGFTPLEALACGTPSLVSDLPVFQETLGAAALRVDPGSPARIAEKLVHLEQDQETRRRIVSAGGPIVRKLTWRRAAAETHRILAEAVDHPHA